MSDTGVNGYEGHPKDPDLDTLLDTTVMADGPDVPDVDTDVALAALLEQARQAQKRAELELRKVKGERITLFLC